MKTNNIKIFVLSVLFSTFLYSCADFDKLNEDPNTSTNMEVDLMIPTVQYFTSSDWQRMHRLFIYPGAFMNQWAGEWASIEYGGHAKKNTGYFEYLWNGTYSEAIKNVVDMVERSKDDPEKVNAAAISRILKVQQFLRLTDYYGDIPYSEAGLGFHQNIIKPKYDEQKDIYHDFLKELKEAAAALDASQIKPKYDLYYNGDIGKWKKLANSLRLRVAMRLVKVDPSLAEAEAKDAIAAGVFDSNADICYVKHEDVITGGDGVGKANAVSNLITQKRSSSGSVFYYSTDFIEAMEKRKDPRIQYIASAYVKGEDEDLIDITDIVYKARGSYAAMSVPAQMWAYELDPSNKYPTASVPVEIEIDGEKKAVELAYSRLRPSAAVEALDAPYIHISYAEVAFLQAEAEIRWGSKAKAEELYAKGLQAAVEQWSLFGIKDTAPAAEQFASVNTLTSGKEIEEINTQLWILHFLDPIESWSNWRRSGYPDVKFYNRTPLENQSNGETPRRIEYPLDENFKNGKNLKEAIDRMGGKDSWTNRVWWDKQ